MVVSLYTHSNQSPITKEDNTVPGWVKVPSWKMCTKPMGAAAKKLKSKQKRDNRRSPIAVVYTLACAIDMDTCMRERLDLRKGPYGVIYTMEQWTPQH